MFEWLRTDFSRGCESQLIMNYKKKPVEAIGHNMVSRRVLHSFCCTPVIERVKVVSGHYVYVQRYTEEDVRDY